MVVTYTEILGAYESDAIDALSALELADCGTIIELYEMAADETDGSSDLATAESPRKVA